MSEVVVLTHLSSPYQVELFDAVEQAKPGWISVYYLHRTDPARNWSAPSPKHRSFFFKDDPAILQFALKEFAQARLAVFNFYAEPPVSSLLARRVSTGNPWVFWGERPGYKHALAGRLIRRWKLRALHASKAPIWGIGSWAVDAYRREFGEHRPYINLPYFSDLSRFVPLTARDFSGRVTFLFSGSLSHRKGVDIMAMAFAHLAAERPDVRLKIMGTGELEPVMRGVLQDCASQVEFLGFRDWVDLPSSYHEAHVLLVPSRHDGWGLVVPEGLAAGLPVIGTNRTGAAIDFIKPETNGWLVKSGDTESLLAAMRSAADLTPEQWQAMSRAALESVATHTIENGARRFLDACRLV